MDLLAMKSLNFERPELAALGAFAERYAHSDPSSAPIQLRMFAARIVHDLFHGGSFPMPSQLGVNGLLKPEVTNSKFEQAATRHPHSASQARFLRLRKIHIARIGSIELSRLYDEPFTLIDGGLEGISEEAEAEAFIHTIETFEPSDRSTTT